MIVRKWAFARAEHIDDDGVAWIAESRAGTGTWVIRESSNEAFGDCAIVGAMIPFAEDGEMLLSMTADQRAELGMADAVYQTLNVQLRLDQGRRERRT